MARVKGGTTARAGRKKILKQAEGYFGSKHRLFKTAKEQLLHSWVYSYRDRKNRKRDFRKLWIIRINAACRENDISYSKFINGLNKAEIKINRKMLSEIAIDNPKNFKELVEISKNALEGKAYTPKALKVEKEAVKATKTKEIKVEKEVGKAAKTKEIKVVKAAKVKEPKVAEVKPKAVKKTVKKVAKKETEKKPAIKKATTKKATVKKTTAKKVNK